MVYLTGYGFPLYRGGPMFYADTVGLPNVVRRMKQLRRQRRTASRRSGQPAPLLAKLAAEGQDVQLNACEPAS